VAPLVAPGDGLLFIPDVLWPPFVPVAEPVEEGAVCGAFRLLMPPVPAVALLPLIETDGLLFWVMPMPFGEVLAVVLVPHGCWLAVGFGLLRLRMPPLALGETVFGEVLDEPAPLVPGELAVPPPAPPLACAKAAELPAARKAAARMASVWRDLIIVVAPVQNAVCGQRCARPQVASAARNSSHSSSRINCHASMPRVPASVLATDHMLVFFISRRAKSIC
jgi:hypothetical protein